MSKERKQRALSRIPAGRSGTVEELVLTALYFSSPSSSFVTEAC